MKLKSQIQIQRTVSHGGKTYVNGLLPDEVVWMASGTGVVVLAEISKSRLLVRGNKIAYAVDNTGPQVYAVAWKDNLTS